jgi:hypothetical protein
MRNLYKYLKISDYKNRFFIHYDNFVSYNKSKSIFSALKIIYNENIPVINKSNVIVEIVSTVPQIS